jgi:Domain of unknown function (DU1801)
MQSKAKTVAEYLASLPPDRREALEAVRKLLRANLDPKIEECMQYGMIGYAIPHSVYPPGYHCNPKEPLPFAGLASQKGYMSLYLCTVYGEEGWQEFTQAWKATGKKLDMGRCCIRFKKLEDLALEVIARHVRSVRAKDYIAYYEATLGAKRASKAAPKAKPAKAKTAKVVKKKSSTRS